MWEKALKAFWREEAGEDVPGRGISLCKVKGYEYGEEGTQEMERWVGESGK